MALFGVRRTVVPREVPRLLVRPRAPDCHSCRLTSSSSLVSVAQDDPSFGLIPPPETPSHPRIIDVQGLSRNMREKVRDYTRNLKIKPKLAGILVDRTRRIGTDELRNPDGMDDAEIYSANIDDTLRTDGMEYELIRCRANTMPEVEQVIQEANRRDDIHGILVFYPIFKHDHQARAREHGLYLNASTGVYYKTPDDYLRDIVDPLKDVEALGTGYNARWLFRARRKLLSEPYIPCTALAVLKILDTLHEPEKPYTDGTMATEQQPLLCYTRRWSGMTATIINRSEILGRPLAALMALQGANVYSIDEHSVLQFLPGGRLRRCHKSLPDCLQESSVVVTAVPSPDFVLPSACVLEGTIVIDVSEHSNVDQLSLLERSNVKLVSQIGACTIAALEQNLLRLYKQQLEL